MTTESKIEDAQVETVEPGMHRRVTRLSDGRYLVYYTFDRRSAEPSPEDAAAREVKGASTT